MGCGMSAGGPCEMRSMRASAVSIAESRERSPLDCARRIRSTEPSERTQIFTMTDYAPERAAFTS